MTGESEKKTLATFEMSNITIMKMKCLSKALNECECSSDKKDMYCVGLLYRAIENTMQ